MKTKIEKSLCTSHGSLLHLPVPQAIDERVEKGGHQSVKYRDHLVQTLVAGAGQEVHEEARAIEQGDDHHVTGACVEDFGPTLCGAHPQDSGEDV